MSRPRWKQAKSPTFWLFWNFSGMHSYPAPHSRQENLRRATTHPPPRGGWRGRECGVQGECTFGARAATEGVLRAAVATIPTWAEQRRMASPSVACEAKAYPTATRNTPPAARTILPANTSLGHPARRAAPPSRREEAACALSGIPAFPSQRSSLPAIPLNSTKTPTFSIISRTWEVRLPSRAPADGAREESGRRESTRMSRMPRRGL